MHIIARSVRAARLSTLSGAAVLTAAVVMLSGCEITEASDSYNSGPVCPAIYDPVCAERRGQERTFPNACEAQSRNWRIVDHGQCRSDDFNEYRRDRDDWDHNSRDSSRDRDFRRDDDRYRDYRRDDDRDRNRQIRPVPPVQPAPPVRQSAPVRPVQPVVPDGACPQIIEQVCGQLGDQTQLFMNRCELVRAGANEVAAGVCMGADR